jgi:hypothetical protein
MIVMMPRSRRVTLTGRRIYSVLLQLAQRRLSVMEKMPAADEIPFEAPLSAILRISGSNGEDRTVAKRYLKEMRSTEVDWESTAPGDGIKYRGFTMLSEVQIEQRNGDNWVRWAFPPTIMGALKDPQRWASLDLSIQMLVGTYAATALYDVCSRYRDNPGGVTSRKPVNWWTDALSPGPAGAERREWRKFKNERIKEAIEDINRNTDLEIELIEHREGRVITEAQFSVRKKAGFGRLTREQQVVDAALVQRAVTLGVPEAKLEKLLEEFGEDPVREKVDALERRVANRELRGLESAYAWLRSVLRNDSEGILAPTHAPGSRTALAASPTQTKEAPGAEPSSVDHEKVRARMAHLRERFERLEPAERNAWVQKVFESVKDNTVFGPVARKRVLGGDYLHGYFGDTLIRAWAEHCYGQNWQTSDE